MDGPVGAVFAGGGWLKANGSLLIDHGGALPCWLLAAGLTRSMAGEARRHARKARCQAKITGRRDLNAVNPKITGSSLF